MVLVSQRILLFSFLRVYFVLSIHHGFVLAAAKSRHASVSAPRVRRQGLDIFLSIRGR